MINRKHRKHIVFFMLLAAVIFILTGCGQVPAGETNGNALEENEQENGAAGTENAEGLTAAVQGKVENILEFRWGDFSDRQVTVEAVMKKCEGEEPVAEYTGIPLSVILKAAQPEAGTTKLTVEADDGYRKHFVLENVLADDTIILTEHDGKLRIVAADAEKYDASYWVIGVVKLTVE